MDRPKNPLDSFHTSPSQRARRGKGATRAKLAMMLIEDLTVLWEEQGDAVLARAAFADPVSVMNAMVRLMPQKIEVSHPTEGMSDEELGQALEHYRRIAAVGAIEGEARIVHEKRLEGSPAEDRGGGPAAAVPPVAEKNPHTIRPAPAENGETPRLTNGVNTDSNDANSSNAVDLPYPVFRRPPVEAPHRQEARNKAKLNDVDPASLF